MTREAREGESDRPREWTHRTEFTVDLRNRLSIDICTVNDAEGNRLGVRLHTRGIDVENVDRIFSMFGSTDEVENYARQVLRAVERVREFLRRQNTSSMVGGLEIVEVRLCARHAAERRRKNPGDTMKVVEVPEGADRCLGCLAETVI